MGHKKFGLLLIVISAAVASLWAQATTFRNAPASAATMKNPYAGNGLAISSGKKLFAQNCAQCHGNKLQGMGPAPPLTSATVQKAKPGELFWFISNGKPDSGMPSWAGLPKNQRWQIVSFLESQGKAK